jgi:hypothetical protein
LCLRRCRVVVGLFGAEEAVPSCYEWLDVSGEVYGHASSSFLYKTTIRTNDEVAGRVLSRKDWIWMMFS